MEIEPLLGIMMKRVTFLALAFAALFSGVTRAEQPFQVIFTRGTERIWQTFDPLDDIWWSKHEESDASLHARGHSFRRTVARDGGWHDIAVVTHWGFIKALTGLTVSNCVMVRFDPTGSSPPAELVPAPQT